MCGGACESGTMFWCEHLTSWNLSAVLIPMNCSFQLAVAPQHIGTGPLPQRKSLLCVKCHHFPAHTPQWPSQSLSLSFLCCFKLSNSPHTLYTENGIKWDIELFSTPKRHPVWFPTLTLSPKEHSARRYKAPNHTKHHLTSPKYPTVYPQRSNSKTELWPTQHTSFSPPLSICRALKDTAQALA